MQGGGVGVRKYTGMVINRVTEDTINVRNEVIVKHSTTTHKVDLQRLLARSHFDGKGLGF